jgi:L-fuculose-phosphate aldolase
MDSQIMETRAHIARIGALLFERHLTDAGGGNISVRVGDVVCISPRYSGQRHRWQLNPEQVLVVDLQGSKLDGDGDLSRESKVHLKLLTEFADAGTAVIHAHSRNTLVFCAMSRPIPPVLEQTLKFGEIQVVDYAPAHSHELANNIANAIRGQEDRVRKQAAGVIAPWHGVFVLGKDLDMAYDAVERIDTNAYIVLMSQLFALPDVLEEQRALLADAVAAYAAQKPV